MRSVPALGVLVLVALPPALAGAEKPSETPPPPSCLDRSIIDELGQSLRPKGVQKKDFLKRRRFELVARGGLYASDLLSSSYIYGGALDWWATEDLGLEVTLDRTPVALDLDAPVADFFGDPRFTAGTGYLGVASVLWSPIHFKLRTDEDSIVHGDATFALGGGRLWHESTQGIALSGGIIVEIFTTSFLTLRLDLRDHLIIQEAVAETRLTNNITAMAGLGFWVPFW